MDKTQQNIRISVSTIRLPLDWEKKICEILYRELLRTSRPFSIFFPKKASSLRHHILAGFGVH